MEKCALVHFCCVSISDFTTFVNHVRIKRKLEFVEVQRYGLEYIQI